MSSSINFFMHVINLLTAEPLFGKIRITILDIVHRPLFYLKHGVSETGFCLRLQAESTQLVSRHRTSQSPDRETHLGQINRDNLCPETETSPSPVY
jgi:hypothetical protein